MILVTVPGGVQLRPYLTQLSFIWASSDGHTLRLQSAQAQVPPSSPPFLAIPKVILSSQPLFLILSTHRWLSLICHSWLFKLNSLLTQPRPVPIRKSQTHPRPSSGSVSLACVAQLGTMGNTWLPSTKTKMENMSHSFGNSAGVFLYSHCQALTRKVLGCLLPNAVSPDPGWLTRARSWQVKPPIMRFIHARKGQRRESILYISLCPPERKSRKPSQN